jgi:hypothetical protein
MKNFQKFLEEADVRGNVGIPGEGEKKPGEPEYLSDVERRAKQRLGIRPEDMPRMGPMGPRPSEKEMRLGMRMMQLLDESKKLSNDNKSELSSLVKDIIYNLYKDIIDRYEIELDIKLVNPREVKSFMEEGEESEPPRMREITDPEVIKEIQKRKIANLVTQGEAKNTKHIIHSDEFKTGLNEILGQRNGEELFKVLDEITKIADQLDWIRLEEIVLHMMENAPEGYGGACKVDWKPKKQKEEEEENQEEDEYTEPEEGQEEDEYFEEPEEGSNPILRARGVDLAVLLHESVKGLFEILSLNGLPVVRDEQGEKDKEKTKELLQKIYMNTGLSDEPQDWKYGPEIAADIRDFVNVNKKIDTYPNIREELWKVMLDKNTMPTDKFLSLVRGILSKSEEARVKVDSLIDRIIEKIKNEKEYQEKMYQYQRDMEEYQRKMREWEEWKAKGELETTEGEEEPESEVDKLVKQSLSKEEPKGEVDYSTWSQKDLQEEIDMALDAGDYEKVRLLSQFLKEGKIYLKELEIINERLNPHTK